MGKREDIKVLIDGKKYVGWRAIANRVGINRRTLQTRVEKQGWSLDEAIQKPIKKQVTPLEISINGKLYIGFDAISEVSGVKSSTLRYRVKRQGWTIEKAISTPIKSKGDLPSIIIDETEYTTWVDIAAKTGISESLLRARVHRLGWSIEHAVNAPVTELGKTGKTISFQEKDYPTQEDFVSSVADQSPFSKTTLKIKMGKLRKQNPDFTEKDLKNLVFGKNEIKDEGGCVYLITSLKTGKQYIGITIRNIKERWKSHQSECGDERIQSPLKNEMRKYGFDNFTIEEIAHTDNSNSLKELEIHEIKRRNTVFPNGLNSNIGGTLGARDVEVFIFEGVEYRSLSDLARKKGIEPGTLNQRINSYGMNLKEAVYFENDTSIEWNGKTYSNLLVFCDALNLDYRRVISLRASNYSMSEIVGRLIQLVSCPICGSEFKRKSSRHKYCSEKCKLKHRYYSKTMSASQTGIPREIKYKGRIFSTISSFCKEYGFKRTKMTQLLQKHSQDVSKAIYDYKNNLGNKRKLEFEGKEYPSVSNFCKKLRLERSAFNKSLIKFDGNVEDALKHYNNRKLMRK